MARNGPPTAEDRARWAKFDTRLSCMPCMHGEHYACRHQPDGPRFSAANSEAGKPCACEREDHKRVAGLCTDYRSGNFGDGNYCTRPAKGTARIQGRFSFGLEDRMVEVERCGIHLAGLRRQAANDAKMREEFAAQREKYAKERANRKASSDWVERLAELGIPAKATGGRALSVIVDPERLYGMVREAVAEMDFAGIEHRFQPLTVTVSPSDDDEGSSEESE